jgi:hypothetical protein
LGREIRAAIGKIVEYAQGRGIYVSGETLSSDIESAIEKFEV